jgi:hypothetical protein
VNGRECLTQQEIEGAFVHYFTELFTSGGNLAVEKCVRTLEKRVNPSMNQRLLEDFKVDEISHAFTKCSLSRLQDLMDSQHVFSSIIRPQCIKRLVKLFCIILILV